MTDAVFVVDDEYEPVMDGLNGVGGVPIFVVKEAEKGQKEAESAKTKKDKDAELYT